MKKTNNKLTMSCSCGNKKAWLFVAKGGIYSNNFYQKNKYFIVCDKCDAEIELNGLGRAE